MQSTAASFTRFIPSLHACIVTFVSYAVLAGATAAFLGGAPPVRMANAVAFVILLRQPVARWPVLLAIVWAASALARQAFGVPMPAAIAVVNILEVAMAAAVVKTAGALPSPWYSAKLIPRLLTAWVLVPAAASLVGTLLVHPPSYEAFLREWSSWYFANVIGMLIVAPMLLSWTDPGIRQSVSETLRGHWITWLVLGSSACAILLAQENVPGLVFLVFPLALLMTWRLRLGGATAIIVTAELVGTGLLLHGHGALAEVMAEGSALRNQVQVLQIFVASLVVCSLPFSALLGRQARMRADLLRTSEARSQFLAAMSHEIRTPMTGLLGTLDLLSAEDLNGQQRRFVENMRISGRHLLAVINDVLDFSRIESGRLAVEQVEFVLPELLEHVRSMLHPLATDRGLGFRLELSPHSPPVLKGDPTRITQILVNLLNNAIKFTPAGQVALHVRCEPQGGSGPEMVYFFEVADTGVGIAPDKLAGLFSAFTQVDSSIARQYGGSGLGLAISRRLAHAMNGEIHVKSQPGAGSTFTLEVPLVEGDPHRLVRRSERQGEAAQPCRILAAEDVQVNREILAALLGRAGHTVQFVPDGAQAVERVQAEPFDLVLMDVQMPVMDGVEATRRIRALPSPVSRIPIIGLTANVMAPEQARYRSAGMDECLMKPIDWAQLSDAIRRYGPGGGSRNDAVATSLVAPAAGNAAAEPVDDVLDFKRLESLAVIAPGAATRDLLTKVLATSEECAAQLQQTRDPVVAGQIAHKLLGSVGTVGFAALARCAQRIQEGAHDGRLDETAIGEMPRVLQATKRAAEGWAAR